MANQSDKKIEVVRMDNSGTKPRETFLDSWLSAFGKIKKCDPVLTKLLPHYSYI